MLQNGDVAGRGREPSRHGSFSRYSVSAAHRLSRFFLPSPPKQSGEHSCGAKAGKSEASKVRSPWKLLTRGPTSGACGQKGLEHVQPTTKTRSEREGVGGKVRNVRSGIAHVVCVGARHSLLIGMFLGDTEVQRPGVHTQRPLANTLPLFG